MLALRNAWCSDRWEEAWAATSTLLAKGDYPIRLFHSSKAKADARLAAGETRCLLGSALAEELRATCLNTLSFPEPERSGRRLKPLGARRLFTPTPNSCVPPIPRGRACWQMQNGSTADTCLKPADGRARRLLESLRKPASITKGASGAVQEPMCFSASAYAQNCTPP